MRLILPALVVAAVAAVAAAGPQAIGRLALRAGFPNVAAGLIETPRWRGVALYRAVRYVEADAAFKRAGLGSTYNRGVTLAVTGVYPLSVEYFESVLYVDEDDVDARFNRDIVASFIDPVVHRSNNIDGLAARADDPDASEGGGTYEMQIQAMMRNRPRLARPDDTEQSVAASVEWLATLADDPGRYLKLRIAAEHQRRLDTGAATWQGGDPW